MFKNLYLGIIKSKVEDVYLLLSSNYKECVIYNLSKNPKEIKIDDLYMLCADPDSVGEFELKKNLENKGYSILAQEEDVWNFINKMSAKEKTGIVKIVSEFKKQISNDYQCQHSSNYKKMLKFIELYGTKAELKTAIALTQKNIKNYNENL